MLLVICPLYNSISLKNITYCGLRNGTVHLKNCKQLFEYQHLLLLRDIWWSKF